jgi:hypothetical protein
VSPDGGLFCEDPVSSRREGKNTKQLRLAGIWPGSEAFVLAVLGSQIRGNLELERQSQPPSGDPLAQYGRTSHAVIPAPDEPACPKDDQFQLGLK